MKIIAITSQKGGVGKTTIAMNLAVAASLDGMPTVILDLDPQASAAAYHDRRVENGYSEQPKAISLQASRLAQALTSAEADGYKLAVIDTPPSVQAQAIHVAKVADMILIPVKPSALDLDAIKASIGIAEMANRPAAAILNQCKPHGALTAEARMAIEQEDKFPVVGQELGDRIAFVYAATSGLGVIESEPSSKAADEVKALWKWVKGSLKKIEREEAAEGKVANG